MKKFEYKYIQLGNSDQFIDNNDMQGLQGWELCGFQYNLAIYKREIPPKNT